jgi:Tannase and feruloyl esterase
MNLVLTFRRLVLSSGAIVVLAGTVGVAQNAQFRDWTPSTLAGNDQLAPHIACGALVSLTGYDISITTATLIPASADAPEFCRVSGLIQPEIRFDVGLPTAWNGRLYMLGNGGYAGEVLDNPTRMGFLKRALARGFATARRTRGTTPRPSRSARSRRARRSSPTMRIGPCTSPR